MSQSNDRRKFLVTTFATGGLFATGWSPRGWAQQRRLDLGAVSEFVRVAHTDLEATEKLLRKEPALALASWDWGGGDWETGLGGAAHTGSVEIVRYLLAHGARMDLFAAAVLGEIEIVEAALETLPDQLKLRGPHGISLLRHAEAGGEDAKEVADYLRSLGAGEEESKQARRQIDADQRKIYIGSYVALTPRGQLAVEVIERDGFLYAQRDAAREVLLSYLGDHEFENEEVEVTFRFKVIGERATSVELKQFSNVIEAFRR